MKQVAHQAQFLQYEATWSICKVTPSTKVVWVERGTESFAQEHNTMSPATAETQANNNNSNHNFTCTPELN